MNAGSWPEFLGVLGATVLLYAIYRICRPAAGRHVLRVRPAKGDARPDGTAAAPAAAAVPLRPGSAGLPNLDHVLPGLRARLNGATAYPRGENPYPERWWSE